MGLLHNISSWPKTQIGSLLIKMAKPTSVFILIGTGNPEFGMEYVSIFMSVPSRSVNFLRVVRSLHPRLLTKSEPTFHFISPDKTPLSAVKAFVSTSWLQHLDLTTDPIHF